MEILTLSTSRNILDPQSRDRARMRLYARHLNALHIVVLTRKEHGLKHDEIHEGNLHIYPTHSDSRLGMLIDSFVSARSVLQKNKKEGVTISSQDPLELGIVSWLLSKSFHLPLNVQVHGDYYSPYWTEGSIARILRRAFIPFVLRSANSIRVVSERIKNSIVQSGIPEAKIKVLPIRPELDVFLHAKRTRENDDAFVILTASRFSKEKDIPRIINAFAVMRQKCPNVFLRIAGKGPLEDVLRKQIIHKHLEHEVTIIPWTEHIQEEMANADVFVLASLHEAYGLVLIEALATGTPLITTDVGCVGELVKDGVHGLVVTKEGDEALAGALIELYVEKDMREKMGEAGKVLGEKLARVSSEDYAKEWVAAHTSK